MLRHDVRLTDEEILLLDGKCDESVQQAVEQAKTRLVLHAQDIPPGLARLLVKYDAAARKTGSISCRYTRSTWTCTVCAVSPPPVLYKSGRRKGEYKQAGVHGGLEFYAGWVTMSGSLDICQACFDKHKEQIQAFFSTVPCEIRNPVLGPNRWKRHNNRKCTRCNWTGHDGLMKKRPTLFGDGSYPAVCPNCSAENVPLCRDLVQVVDGYTLVPVAQESTT